MKKTLIAALALFLGSISFANAQETATDTIPQIKPVFVTLYGGPTFSINENGGAFFEEGCPTDLIDWVQGGISAGCYFSNRYGARVSLEYSNNMSANNHDETFALGLFKYTFREGSIFTDFIINGGNMNKIKKFYWRPYCGIGAAYSFDFKTIRNEEAGLDSHPWQGRNDGNFCLGFRYGLILEYEFNESFGIYLDGSHEWFMDNFNGMPYKFGQHLGFPFDMKLNANFGLAFHF